MIPTSWTQPNALLTLQSPNNVVPPLMPKQNYGIAFSYVMPLVLQGTWPFSGGLPTEKTLAYVHNSVQFSTQANIVAAPIVALQLATSKSSAIKGTIHDSQSSVDMFFSPQTVSNVPKYGVLSITGSKSVRISYKLKSTPNKIVTKQLSDKAVVIYIETLLGLVSFANESNVSSSFQYWSSEFFDYSTPGTYVAQNFLQVVPNSFAGSLTVGPLNEIVPIALKDVYGLHEYKYTVQLPRGPIVSSQDYALKWNNALLRQANLYQQNPFNVTFGPTTCHHQVLRSETTGRVYCFINANNTLYPTYQEQAYIDIKTLSTASVFMIGRGGSKYVSQAYVYGGAGGEFKNLQNFIKQSGRFYYYFNLYGDIYIVSPDGVTEHVSSAFNSYIDEAHRYQNIYSGNNGGINGVVNQQGQNAGGFNLLYNSVTLGLGADGITSVYGTGWGAGYNVTQSSVGTVLGGGGGGLDLSLLFPDEDTGFFPPVLLVDDYEVPLTIAEQAGYNNNVQGLLLIVSEQTLLNNLVVTSTSLSENLGTVVFQDTATTSISSSSTWTINSEGTSSASGVAIQMLLGPSTITFLKNGQSSPSTYILQMPLVKPVPVQASPGSSDTDGLVRIYDCSQFGFVSNTTPGFTSYPVDIDSLRAIRNTGLKNVGDPAPLIMELKASKLPQRFHAPLTYLGPCNNGKFTIKINQGLQSSQQSITQGVNILVTSMAIDSTSQYISRSNCIINFNNNEASSLLAHAFFDQYRNSYINIVQIFTLHDTIGALTQTKTKVAETNVLFSNFFHISNDESNLLTLKASNNSTLWDANPSYWSDIFDGISIVSEIETYISIQLYSANILDPPNEIASIAGTIEVDDGTAIVKRYTTADGAQVPSFFNSDPTNPNASVPSWTIFEAWGAGGCSIPAIVVNATYGGASPRCVVQLDAPILRLEVEIGLKGVADFSEKNINGTGGTRTRVIADFTTILSVGGGGGASFGSHGGQAGYFDESYFLDPPNIDTLVVPGKSASWTSFTTRQRDAIQASGPSSKPTNDDYQGSGSSSLQNGLSGFFDNNGHLTFDELGAHGGTGFSQGDLLSVNDLQQESTAYSSSFLFMFGEPSSHGGTGSTCQEPSSTFSRGRIGSGGGGGGSTYINTLAKIGGLFFNSNVIQRYCRPPWTLKTYKHGILGGTTQFHGTNYNSSHDLQNIHEPYYNSVLSYNCNYHSLLSWALDTSTNVDKHKSLAKLLMKDAASKLSLQSTPTKNHIGAKALQFTSGQPNFTSIDVPSVPIGLYQDKAQNIQLVQKNETQYFETLETFSYNTSLSTPYTLCVINEGQFDTSNLKQYINTVIRAPLGTFVTVIMDAYQGMSRPNQSYNCIFLNVQSKVPVSALINGFLTMDALISKPQGNQCFGTLNSDAALAASTQSTVVRNIDLSTSNALADVMYSGISSFVKQWLSIDLPQGLNTISSVWPFKGSTYFQIESSVQQLFSAVPLEKPLRALPSSVFTFSFTGSIQTFKVPSNAKSITVHAYGGGGHSLSELNLSTQTSNLQKPLHKGAQGTYVRSTFKDLRGKTIQVFVGKGGSNAVSPPGPRILLGGFDSSATYAYGGGLSAIADGLHQDQSYKFLLVAAGGGCAGLYSDAVPEGTAKTHYLQGDTGKSISSLGLYAVDGISGPGGSGFVGGSNGTKGFSGASGESFLPPKYSFRSTNVEKQPFWTPGIALGSTNKYGSTAGNGKVIIEINF